MYLERLDASGIDSSIYFPILGNENDMPNCTACAHNVAQEACDDIALQMFSGYSAGGFPGALNWPKKTILPKGKEPRFASIGCCSNEGGTEHVFYIVRKNENGKYTITDSRYSEDKSDRSSDRFFRKLDNVDLQIGKSPLAGVGILTDFIYLPVKDIRTIRDETKDQIEITSPGLNCRISYGVGSPLVREGCYVPLGIYNILETKEANGYLWCKVEENRWFAYSDQWANLYLVSDQKEDADEFEDALNSFVRRMRNEHNSSVAIRQGLSDISVIIDRLMKL